MAQVAMEERVAHIEGRVDGFDARFDSLERRLDGVDRGMADLRGEMSALRVELTGRMDRAFQWTTGINVALWSTILVAIFFRP